MTYTVHYHNANTRGKRVFHTEGKANWFIGYMQSIGYTVDLLYIA